MYKSNDEKLQAGLDRQQGESPISIAQEIAMLRALIQEVLDGVKDPVQRIKAVETSTKVVISSMTKLAEMQAKYGAMVTPNQMEMLVANLFQMFNDVCQEMIEDKKLYHTLIDEMARRIIDPDYHILAVPASLFPEEQKLIEP
jgi:hypothetical protein